MEIKKIIEMIKLGENYIDKKVRFLIYDIEFINKMKKQNGLIIINNNLTLIDKFLKKTEKSLIEKEYEKIILEIKR